MSCFLITDCYDRCLQLPSHRNALRSQGPIIWCSYYLYETWEIMHKRAALAFRPKMHTGLGCSSQGASPASAPIPHGCYPETAIFCYQWLLLLEHPYSIIYPHQPSMALFTPWPFLLCYLIIKCLFDRNQKANYRKYHTPGQNLPYFPIQRLFVQSNTKQKTKRWCAQNHALWDYDTRLQ